MFEWDSPVCTRVVVNVKVGGFSPSAPPDPRQHQTPGLHPLHSLQPHSAWLRQHTLHTNTHAFRVSTVNNPCCGANVTQPKHINTLKRQKHQIIYQSEFKKKKKLYHITKGIFAQILFVKKMSKTDALNLENQIGLNLLQILKVKRIIKILFKL